MNSKHNKHLEFAPKEFKPLLLQTALEKKTMEIHLH